MCETLPGYLIRFDSNLHLTPVKLIITLLFPGGRGGAVVMGIFENRH
jgi:hypothetical protein